jgi:hypothetical protein
MSIMENGFSQGSDGFKEMTPLEREAAERKTRDAREAEERKAREREIREAREREREREVAWKRDRDQQERELKIRLENGAYIIRDDRGRPLRTRENAIREDLLAREIDRRIARDPSQSNMTIKTQLCREYDEGRIGGGVGQQLVDEGHLKQYRDDKERQRQIDNMRQRERDDIGRRRDDLDRGLER